jgi:hypothetical protein
MKTLSFFLGKFGLAALVGLAAMSLAISTRADFPVIQSIQVEPTNIVVTASVPAGQTCIVLESRDNFAAGTWMPLAVQRAGSQGGTITFRLPRTAEFAFLRVRADETEPLPASFYTGAKSFDAQPVSGTGGSFLTTFAGVDAFNAPAANTPTDSREVVESDIWRLDGDTLYFFNQNRGLQVIDVAKPDAPALRGTLNLPAAGEQMYLLPTNHVVLLTRTTCGMFNSIANNDQVLIVAVSNGVPAIVASLSVDGTIAESRLVGTALYVASQTIRPVPGSGGGTWEWGTHIASFDLTVPDAPIARSTLWYSGYGNAVYATDTYFFAVTQDPTNWQQSIVNAIDITAPDGTMSAYDSITPTGRVADKFKLNWCDGIFSVISEVSSSPLVTKLETFRMADPRSVPPFAHVKLGEVELGHGERLFATRFDGTRAYVVTFLRIDPLWVVDLSDPAHPTVSGELQVPGWSTYIHPLGNRLVAVGVETNRTTVSLFDVSNPAHPALLSRVPLGYQYSYSEANSDEKAFTVIEDAGLILLPVQGYTTNGYLSWIQLIELGTNSLTARGIIEHDFAPRRATLHRDRILSLSAAELLSVDATDRDHPQLTGRLKLTWPINRVFVAGDYLIELTTGNAWSLQAEPTVNVVPAFDPNQILTTLTLANDPIVGATVRSNHLYLAQAASTQIVTDTNVSFTSTLRLSVVDLTHLPALNVLGETAATISSPPGWGVELEPVWPNSDLLVWVGGGNNYFWWWGRPYVSMPFDLVIGNVWYWPYPFQNSGGGRLFAFDVSSNTAPVLLSEVKLNTNGWWNLSKPFAADGLVYLSHNAYVNLDPTNTTDLTNIYSIYWPGFQRSFLDVVDFADASHPAVRPPVNIPGGLQGISHNGSLLYTVGFHRTSTNWYEGADALDASAYDGVAAYLVDSLSLSNNWLHPALVSGTNIYLGSARPVYATNVILPTLETWTLSGAGNFTQLGSTTLTTAASDLVPFPGLLAAQTDGAHVRVFDDSNPAALRQVGDGPTTGCLYFNLRHGDAAPARDLWLPLDAYGVISIKLSP